MRKLVKATSLLTLVNVSEMATRFVRTKCIALFLGVAGSGLFAQLAIFFELTRAWCSLGTRRAVIRQIGENRKEGAGNERYREVIQTSFSLELVSACVIASLATVFSKTISQKLFADPAYYPYVIAFSWILPFASLVTLFGTILKANMEYKLYTAYTMGAHLVIILAVPFAIYRFGYWGAASAQWFFFAVPLAAYVILHFRKPFLFFSRRVNFGMLKELVVDGTNVLYQTTVGNVIKLFLTSLVIMRLGLDSMGIYQVVLTFTTVYLTIPIQAISGYTMPVIAAAADNREINKAVNDSLRFLCYVLMPVIAGLILWPAFFIEVFYSREFFAAVPILRLQLLGTVFDIANHALGSSVAAKGKYRALYVIGTVHSVFYFGLSWLFFLRWELPGLAFGFAIANILVTAMLFYLNRKYFSFTLSRENFGLFLSLGLWLGLAFFVAMSHDGFIVKAAVTALGIPWAYFNLTPRERDFLFTRARALVSGRRSGGDSA
ncbi:MAG: hypothetical protein A3C47_01620 [Omnitrophica bacterium RIFCSPHIGHO2_02_FULL_51_18]|nr:MAG: hypothetical protein A3C47_01620 [Omnitrophica bacterium RIFCSPHIGHO2_02_FULL_51_18]